MPPSRDLRHTPSPPGPKPRASATTAASARATATAEGFAPVHALGENGTHGDRDGRILTLKTLSDLEKYATASEPYVIVLAATIDMDPVGNEIEVAGHRTINGSGRSAQILDSGFFLGQGVHDDILRSLPIGNAYQGVRNGTFPWSDGWAPDTAQPPHTPLPAPSQPSVTRWSDGAEDPAGRRRRGRT